MTAASSVAAADFSAAANPRVSDALLAVLAGQASGNTTGDGANSAAGAGMSNMRFTGTLRRELWLIAASLSDKLATFLQWCGTLGPGQLGHIIFDIIMAVCRVALTTR